MNILLTNDDGISAEGINSLFRILSKEHAVFMIAPRDEKSGSSSAITLKSPLNVESISKNKFAVHGFPVDCVSIGLNGDIIPGIDLVISGINNGPNLGDDVYFSGTVAGARTAFIFGISGISISIDCNGNSKYFDDASRFLLKYIDDLKELTKEGPVFLNINYPDTAADKLSGVKYTFLGKRIYNDIFKIRHQSDYQTSMELNGTISSKKIPGSDITEVGNGYISITPMTLDCTDYRYLKQISSVEATVNYPNPKD